MPAKQGFMKNLFPTDRYTAVYYNKPGQKALPSPSRLRQAQEERPGEGLHPRHTGGLYRSDKKKNFLGFEKDGEICDWSHAEKAIREAQGQEIDGR